MRLVSRVSACVLVAVACALFPTGITTRAEEFILRRDVTTCENDERYNAGGATMGDCLLETGERVDKDIADTLLRESERSCAPSDRADLAAAQQQGQSYRERQCGLIWRSPTTTSSYISYAVRHLLLGRQRQKALRVQSDYSGPHCLEYVLSEDASRYGEQAADAVVQIPASGLEWSVVGRHGDRWLEVRNTASKSAVASMDISRCNFCSGDGDNCARDGILVMQPTKSPSRPAVFHVCHVGAHSQRLQLIDPVASGSEILLDVTGAYYLDWEISDGALHVLPDGDRPRSVEWPRL